MPDVIRKSYPATKQAIALARRDVAALVAEYLEADGEAIENVKLAVSEAATSVLASLSFEANARRIQVAVASLGCDRLGVIVSDDGLGAAPRGDAEPRGISFRVIRGCADSLQLRKTPTGGVEIDMQFIVQAAGALRPDDGSGDLLVA